ncbi:AhpC/Tsa family protein GSU0066 [hydrothermal vent metagenome]|uniref:thioredoxin-dependent peroxiredoxin n=1 Tax=hydrothermal vent metagenome TaxID=652676 RepID=A0A3B0XY88_9ZZZZ
MSTVINPPSYKENVSELIGQLKGMFPEDKFAVFNNDANQLAQAHVSPLSVKRGDLAPDFSLPDVEGNSVKLQDLLAAGPLVLTFYRGVWCPYCNLHLKLLQQILPEIKGAGANLVAISPMNPDSSKGTIETGELEFKVLSDPGNKVARQYTKVFKNADEPINTMAELGYDFYSFYDDRSAELPVSATFIIASDGVIGFAESEGGDYRKRTEPRKILDALESIK